MAADRFLFGEVGQISDQREAMLGSWHRSASKLPSKRLELSVMLAEKSNDHTATMQAQIS
jgi:hypothetical protein